MGDNEWDMFSSQPVFPEQTATIFNESNSCPTNKEFTFGFLILFNWDEKIQRPFKLFPRKTFDKGDISDRCYDKHIGDVCRIKKLKSLKALPNEKLSLFAKVEGGKIYLDIPKLFF